MTVSGKAVAVVAGLFIGGGIGFYWRQTYWLDASRQRKYELEAKLSHLVESRKGKEDYLQNNK